jgi:hypothetical protein
MTREERMREIFNSKECDERKLIAYQHVVIEELQGKVAARILAGKERTGGDIDSPK